MTLESLENPPKTKEELAKEEQERKERNVRITRLVRGIGIIIRGFGKALYKIGNGIVKACDRSLAKPENRRILEKMGKLPKKDKKEKSDYDKSVEEYRAREKEKGKEIIIKIPK